MPHNNCGKNESSYTQSHIKRRSWWIFLGDFLFPRTCLVCRKIGKYICLGCQGKLSTTHKQYCLECGAASMLGLTHIRCRRKYGAQGFTAVYYYNGALKRVIGGCKYPGSRLVLEELLVASQKPLEHAVRQWREACLINQNTHLIPLPLHPKRQRQRGFNQAQIIAEYIGRISGMRLRSDLLMRTTNTKQQAKLKGDKQRKQNIRGAFALAKGVRDIPQGVVLVDDVVTTGHTAREAVSTLIRAGVRHVYVIALAKG